MFSLVSIVIGWVPARRRKPKRWIANHAYWMTGSYVGLLAAASAEIFSRAPNTPFWAGVIGGTALVMLAGMYLIGRHVPRILAGFGRGAS